ncbi:allantoinase AllB [Saxibacter everestensis]|uniref:Allantoinase AllB n=1 Tax=Saxibacter everestensis TaxID=2909229 RepID=A0ABY8QTP8_9MICO|nr:allantoinase AllB [Brevibacteriaceae bacterium ZFBP1038]
MELADLQVEDGIIAAIGPELTGAGEEIDGEGQHLLPGVFDCHVHFNDPGRAHWEGWPTGSAAAAMGGTTTVLDMPFNSLPPTVDRASFEAKLAAARGRSLVDFGLFGGLHGGNLAHLEELSDLGVAGFKAFMCDTGLDEFPGVTEDELYNGMLTCARLGRPVLVHAETHPGPHENTIDGTLTEQVRGYLGARPASTETKAVRRAIEMAEATGARLHVVHLSTGEGAALVAEARRRGVDVSAETCPHYLTFTAEDVERLGALAKCAPPIRDQDNREALWSAVTEGIITMVGSDHSPAGPAEKLEVPFAESWGGIAGCQSLLPVMLTEGMHGRDLSLPTIARLLASAPAERFGFPAKAGLRVGADADLVLVRLSDKFELSVEALQYQHQISPYTGRTFTGKIARSWRRGTPLVVEGHLMPTASDGKFHAASTPTPPAQQRCKEVTAETTSRGDDSTADT